MNCKTCKFWDVGTDAEGDADTGLCRRNPPVTANRTRNNFPGVWPETYSDDWCGEYAPASLEQLGFKIVEDLESDNAANAMGEGIINPEDNAATAPTGE